VDVEWVILADAAEVVNNKLYLIGGGWQTLTINSALPVGYPCAVAVALSVPWNETNQQQNIEVAIEDHDGAELVKVDGQVEVGRPPGIPLGNAQRIQMAIKVLLPLQRLGKHGIIVRVEGQEARRAPFNVVAGSDLVARQLSQGAA
jgi:hypothetical protein